MNRYYTEMVFENEITHELVHVKLTDPINSNNDELVMQVRKDTREIAIDYFTKVLAEPVVVVRFICGR